MHLLCFCESYIELSEVKGISGSKHKCKGEVTIGEFDRVVKKMTKEFKGNSVNPCYQEISVGSSLSLV